MKLHVIGPLNVKEMSNDYQTLSLLEHVSRKKPTAQQKKLITTVVIAIICDWNVMSCQPGDVKVFPSTIS